MSTPASAQPVGVLPPPPGVTTDFTNGLTHLQIQIIILHSIICTLSAVVLAARIYTRARLTKVLGIDDALAFLGWLACIGQFVMIMLAMRFGLGKHLWNVTGPDLLVCLKYLSGIGMLYTITPVFLKLSLLVMYHRFSLPKGLRIFIYLLGIFVVGTASTFIGLLFGPCSLLNGGAARCAQQLNLTLAIVNIVTDAVIILIPIPIIRGLNLPKKQKILLAGVLALGSGVTIVSIARIIYVNKILQASPDQVYYIAVSMMFSAVELNVGVICVSVIVLKPFFVRHMPFVTRWMNRSSPVKTPTPGGSSKRWRPKAMRDKDEITKDSYEMYSAGLDKDTVATVESTSPYNPDGTQPSGIKMTTSYDVEGASTGKSDKDFDMESTKGFAK